MKALTYHAASDDFVLRQLPVPELKGDYDVLVQVHATGLNPVDAKIHLWKGMVPDMGDDFVGGLDVAGEIVDAGDRVEGWGVGDRVLYHGDMRRPYGGFAEFALHDSRTLVSHPDVPAELAAATPCAGWTAYRALFDKLDAKNRSSIFIAGGSGGVGSFAIQLASFAGIETIITTCSKANHEYVRCLGATHAIDYRNQDVVAEAMALTYGQGVDVALDCVGGDNDILCASVLGFEGQMVELVRTVRPEAYPDAFMRGLSFHQFSLGAGHVNGSLGRHDMQYAGERFSYLTEREVIRVPELEVIGFDELGTRLKTIREGRTVGKLVLKP